MTQKVYNRQDPKFVETLLLPRTSDVLTRLMSPQDRAKLQKKLTPSSSALEEALAEVAEMHEDFDEDVARRVMLKYIENLNDEIGPYAYYPADFNYLAHAIGSSPERYSPWAVDVGNLHITPGVTTIFAETGAGKSTMADLLVFNLLESFDSSESIMRIKFGESGTDLETFLRFSELAEALPTQLPPVVVIDSVRLQTFDMGGASRSLSISNQLFRWLTEIDIFAVGHGVAVILVMNPLAGEEDKIEQFRGDVESSVMSVINLTSYNTGEFKHRGERNGRKSTPFVIPGEIERNSSVLLLNATDNQDASTVTTVTSSAANPGGRTPYGRKVVQRP